MLQLTAGCTDNWLVFNGSMSFNWHAFNIERNYISLVHCTRQLVHRPTLGAVLEHLGSGQLSALYDRFFTSSVKLRYDPQEV